MLMPQISPVDVHCNGQYVSYNDSSTKNTGEQSDKIQYSCRDPSTHPAAKLHCDPLHDSCRGQAALTAVLQVSFVAGYI